MTKEVQCEVSEGVTQLPVLVKEAPSKASKCTAIKT